MRLTRSVLALAPWLVGACTAASGPNVVETSDPNTLAWITPGSVGDPGITSADQATNVRAGDPFDLGVSTQAADATVLHFVLDGTEVGTCDTSDPASDCRQGSEWLWTFTIPTPGHHVVEVWFLRADGSTERLRRELDVLPAGEPMSAPAAGASTEADPVGDDALVLDGTSDFNDAPMSAPALDDAVADPDVPASDPSIAAVATGPADTDVPPDADDPTTSHGYLDPSLAAHAVYGGLAWSVQGHRVVFAHGALDADNLVIGDCVRQYGASVNRYADQYNVSRAAIVAAAVAATGCDADSPRAAHGVMGVRASTCAAITASDPQPLDAATCAQRMHDSPDFAIEIGTRWLASTSLRQLHHSDPPLMAAAFATGAVAPSNANRWHLLAPPDASGQHDFITSFVAAYNAYRTNEHIAILLSTTLPTDGMPLAPAGVPAFDSTGSSAELDADAALQTSDADLDIAAVGSLEAAATGAATHSPVLMRYHGGPVMNAAIDVYVIWWGARWRHNAGRETTIHNFINRLNDSPWWQTNSTYSDGSHHRVSRTIRLAGELHVDARPSGGNRYMRISSTYPNRVVAHYAGHGFPLSSHAMYLVMTDDRTRMTGFGTKFCGWHTVESVAGTNVVFAWVGDGAVVPTSCGYRYSNANIYPGPHNDPVDATMSVVGHELAEAATDPWINGWYEGRYNEIGDKCAWNWGRTTATSPNHYANLRLHGENYLIQQLWSNGHGGRCVMHP